MKAHVQWFLQLWMVTNTHVLCTPMQSKILCQKKTKGTISRERRLKQKWASRWTENPKGRSRQKLETKITIILIGWNPKRAIYAKVKDHDKVTTSVRHDPLGASSYQKTPNPKHLQTWNKGYVHQSGTVHLGHPVIKRHPIQNIYKLETGEMRISQARSIWGIQLSENLKVWSICNSKTRNRGNSKLLGRITVIVFNVPSPYIYHFPKLLKKKSVEPRHWQVTTQFTKFEPVPIYLELSFILHTKFLFFDGNTWSKNFQNTKTFFTSFEKVWTTNTHSLNSWVIGSVHPHPPRERLHSGRETWLGTVERTSALSKMQSYKKIIEENHQKAR